MIELMLLSGTQELTGAHAIGYGRARLELISFRMEYDQREQRLYFVNERSVNIAVAENDWPPINAAVVVVDGKSVCKIILNEAGFLARRGDVVQFAAGQLRFSIEPNPECQP